MHCIILFVRLKNKDYKINFEMHGKYCKLLTRNIKIILIGIYGRWITWLLSL